MEELLMLAGYHSDTDSIRSSTVNIEAIKVRKRSGRKQQAPRRAAFDSDYVVASAEQPQQGHQAVAHEQATAESALEESPAGASLQAVTAAADPAAQQVIVRPASAPSARGKKGKQDLAGPCCHCNATNSPQWRKGPKGKPVLCNACGIRFLRNRTLTKVVPKKRRAGTAAPREAAPPVTAATAVGAPKAKRVKTEAALQEDDDLDLATDEVLVTEDTLIATDDSIEEAHSGSTHPALTHVDPTAAAAAPAVDLSMLTAHPQQRAVNSGGSSSSGYELHGSPMKCSSGGVQQLAAGSTHLLLGVNSCVSHNPSLSLALALHQKQHQDEPSPTSAAYGSPVSNASAYLHSDSVLGSPPASPLVLGDTSGVSNMLMAQQQQVPSLWMSPLQQQQKFVTDVSSQLLPEPAPLSLMGSTATTAAAAPGQQGPLDILQLVQQISSVLGGVGPAVEFIKAMQTGGAAAAAAAAAAAVGLRQ